MDAYPMPPSKPPSPPRGSRPPEEVLSPERVQSLHAQLLAWYATSRRDLPWRNTKDPYAIWLSEVMLQQTRVETVIPYWERFLTTLPTVHALAEAPLAEVLSLWSGLGYYRRARMLHRAAQQVVETEGGQFPATAMALQALHGVGAYTAGAVASIAFGEPAALVDGNVERVLSRLFLLEDDLRSGAGKRRVWRLAEALIPTEAPGNWNQALMELGATVCTPREPRCLLCPVPALCLGRAAGRERTLPKLPGKKPVTRVRGVALVAGHENAVLLARRHEEGLFGGLWEPPLVYQEAPHVPPGKPLQEHFSDFLATFSVSPLHPAGAVSHLLSHLRFEVEVFAGALSDCAVEAIPIPSGYTALALIPRAEVADRGLATLGRKILRKGLGVDPPSSQGRGPPTARG